MQASLGSPSVAPGLKEPQPEPLDDEEQEPHREDPPKYNSHVYLANHRTRRSYRMATIRPILTESMTTEKMSNPTSKLGPAGKLMLMCVHFTGLPA